MCTKPSYMSHMCLHSASVTRLASGDNEGGVVVWDVLTQSATARLDEAILAGPLIGGGAAKSGLHFVSMHTASGCEQVLPTASGTEGMGEGRAG